MKPLRTSMMVLLSFCFLAFAHSAKAQYYGSDGQVYTTSQISYDIQTGFVLAEGTAHVYASHAEIITQADWELDVELYGPHGFVGSDFDYITGYDNTLYAYVSTYAQESGYGEYTTYATPSIRAGSIDYLGFSTFEWQEGFGEIRLLGGPYYYGMPCWYIEPFWPAGPCHCEPPTPYLQQPYELGMSRDSRTVDPPPKFDVAYSSYIPVDHVFGPPTDRCLFNGTLYNLIYAGDANRGTYRTTEAVRIIPDLQQSSGEFRDTGKTRNYGAGSPIHPPNLTLGVAPPNGDDDSIGNDCHWWNAEDQADSSSFLLEKDYPAIHQGHVRFKGAAANPLVISPEIDWEFDIVVDAANPSYTTARLTWKHDCYPAHVVKINGKTVYSYVPDVHDWTFITQCLSGVGQVIDSVGPIAVPPQPPQ
jgi:hypothetical protein